MDRNTAARLGLILGVLAALGAGLFLASRDAVRDDEVRAAQASVDAAAGRAALMLGQVRTQLRAHIGSDLTPALMTLGNGQGREQAAARMREQLPYAVRVALIPVDWLSEQGRELALLDPACRQAVLRAQTDGPQAVVHEDDPAPHLSLVEPVGLAGGPVAGVVYVQYAPPWSSWVGPVAADTTLAIGAESESIGPFVIAGAPGRTEQAHTYLRAPLRQSGLSLHLWSTAERALPPNLLAAAAAFAAAVLVLLVGVTRIDRRARTTLRRDALTLAGMIEDIRQGDLKPEYPVAMDEFRDLQNQLNESGGHLVNERRKLEDLGLTDHLSGLPNRRAFEMRLAQHLVQARMGFPTAVLLLDVDHFKSVNDRHGHDAGDALIRIFAESIHDAVRRTDYVARLGGDEFCIMFPFTDLATAFMLAERLRSKLPATAELGNGVQHRLRWTGGLSVMMHHDDKADDVLWRADKVLLEAKAAGRNRTFVYDSPEKLQRA